ncbi:MAG: thioesterase family protein [Acidimicrobiia bacterium]|nr:thioesterase family protein [Acidimicrobiia bacterium]
MDFIEMMALEPHGPDTYVGAGPSYPWGGLFGGQIVAQALRAGGLTVDSGFVPHSLHAYYIRPGDHSEPIRFEVDRLRNGRSFATRQVVARQSNGAILTMIASFKRAEASAEVQVVSMPDVPGPDGLEPDSWTDLYDRRSVASPNEPHREQAWIRINGDLRDDPLLHACGLAYSSDDLPAEPVGASHPERRSSDHATSGLSGVSLDHAVWFHRPFRADEWRLEDVDVAGIADGRGLARGAFFSVDGTHIASVAQEVLIRVRRPK